MRRILATSLAVALVVLAPAGAQAASTSKHDANDTQGRLDLKRVSLKMQGKKIVVTVATYDAFTNDDLTGGDAFGVDFKVGKTKTRGIAIRTKGSGLHANICTYKTTGSDPKGSQCSTVSVKRLSAKSLQVAVPRAKIDKGATSYRWRGGSFALPGGAGCSTTPYCLDSTVTKADHYHLWRL